MIRIRPCAGWDEIDACVELQIEIWGYDANDAIPRRVFLLAQKIGGQIIGAFETEGSTGQGTGQSAGQGAKQSTGAAELLVGFAMSLPGVKTGDGEPRAYLHSHMLAVKEAYRNRGLGTQLKREQRRDALSRGIRHMEWTFDPLEIKNAFLNIHRLGAVVRAYHANFYGVSSSPLQGGLPTDRLLAEWELDSARVQAVLEGRLPAGAVREPVIEPVIDPVIEQRILVPASIYQWKASEAGRERALAVQFENRLKFEQAFSQGLAVTGFSLDADGNGVFELGSIPRA